MQWSFYFPLQIIFQLFQDNSSAHLPKQKYSLLSSTFFPLLTNLICLPRNPFPGQIWSIKTPGSNTHQGFPKLLTASSASPHRLLAQPSLPNSPLLASLPPPLRDGGAPDLPCSPICSTVLILAISHISLACNLGAFLLHPSTQPKQDRYPAAFFSVSFLKFGRMMKIPGRNVISLPSHHDFHFSYLIPHPVIFTNKKYGMQLRRRTA